jgi:hypothetical protein
VCLLPLVAVLALLAMYRNTAWPAVLALVSVGLSFLAVWNEIAGYQSSNGWEEVDKQAARRELVRAFAVPLAVAAFSLCWVIGVRLLGPPRESAPESSAAPPASPGSGWVWDWLRRRSGWLVVLAAVLALMAMLAR